MTHSDPYAERRVHPGTDADAAPEMSDAQSRPRKRSITIAGHSTSVSLEEAFWAALQEIAASRDTRVADLIAEIDSARGAASLSGAIRVFVLAHYRASAGS